MPILIGGGKMDKNDARLLIKDTDVIWDNVIDIEDYLQSMYNPMNKSECNVFNKIIEMLSRIKHVVLVTQRDILSIAVLDNIEEMTKDEDEVK